MNAAEERASVMHGRIARWRNEGAIDAKTAEAVAAAFPLDWRTHGVMVQIAFSAMTIVAVLASYGFLTVLGMPARGIAIGAAAIVLAEVLIRRLRWWGTGVEAALWIGGTFALVTELPRSGTPEAMLILAAATALPAARLRNPLFGAIATMFVVAWVEMRFDGGAVAAIVMASVAAVALTRSWRRPSTEWLWTAIAVLLPFAGWIAADAEWRRVTILLYAIFGIAVLMLALARRHHALFFAGAAGVAIAVVELARVVSAPAETVLAASGALLMLVAWSAARALRGRTRGLVATPSKLTVYDDDVEVAGAILTAPAAPAEPSADARPQGDGGFGGAGATGDY